MQTGDRAALCPWASSLWGGQSAVILSRGKGRWWVVIILPTANWLVRALGLPSVCESSSSRTPGRAKVSSQRDPAPTQPQPAGQIGHRKGDGSSTLGGEVARQGHPSLHCPLHHEWPHPYNCHQLVFPKERGSACTSAAPLSQFPSQLLARCPGCGQVAA